MSLVQVHLHRMGQEQYSIRGHGPLEICKKVFGTLFSPYLTKEGIRLKLPSILELIGVDLMLAHLHFLSLQVLGPMQQP